MNVLELPFGIRTTKPAAADFWYGPWASVAAAKAGVPRAIRTLGLTVFVIGIGKHCWRNGLEDADLVLDQPEAPTLSGLVAADNRTLGDVDFVGGFTVKNLKNPVVGGDGANKTYADLKESNAKAYADSLVTSSIKFVGYWDASVGTFPIVVTGGGEVKAGNQFDISVAGTIAGETFEKGDTIRALEDNPLQDSEKWAKGQVNTEQASETKIGIMRIGTQAETNEYLLDSVAVTPEKLGGAIVEEKKWVNYQVAMTGETEQAVYMENAGEIYDVKFAGCNSIKLKIEMSGTYPESAQTYPFSYPANSRVFFTFNYDDQMFAKCSIKFKCKDN
jgi:hypothetical protein